uniref:Uncharacterized protein n=1 Tax=Glossina palpalis gambiensis TaxID=67801 RepID=A0A1B0AXG4_9MUSC
MTKLAPPTSWAPTPRRELFWPRIAALTSSQISSQAAAITFQLNYMATHCEMHDASVVCVGKRLTSITQQLQIQLNTYRQLVTTWTPLDAAFNSPPFKRFNLTRNEVSFSQKELNDATATSTPNGNWWPVASNLLIIIFTLLLPLFSNGELVFKMGEFGLLLKCESILSKPPPTPLSQESAKLSKFCFSLLHLVGEIKAADEEEEEEEKLRVDDVMPKNPEKI